MRFAGEAIQNMQKDRPVVPGFNPDDLQHTPELPAPTLRQQYQRDNYILRPRSGVALLPGGVQGPSQGPNTPIKNYGGQYMPDGSQPSGYKPGPIAAVPAGLLPKVFVKEAIGGMPTADGTLYKGQPDPFQENNKIRPSDSDDQFMDVMRSGFV